MLETKKNTYANYLNIQKLLATISPKTKDDDEPLFIVVHQVHELWFNLVIHELGVCVRDLYRVQNEGDLLICAGVNERLHRVTLIQRSMVSIWDVVATLPPNSFINFRDNVGQDTASGFQSVQYRIYEFLLGMKYHTIKYRVLTESGYQDKEDELLNERNSKQENEKLNRALKSPSIYDAVIFSLSQIYKQIRIEPRRVFEERHTLDLRVRNAWIHVYEHAAEQTVMHQMGELLIEIEDGFRRWRHAHVLAVSRIIGSKPGTGGSAGLPYLREKANEALDSPIYAELWDIRNTLQKSNS